MHTPSLTSTASFQALETHAIDAEDWQMRGLFGADPQRFERLSVEAAGLFLDYSKNRLDGRTLDMLAALARERGVEERARVGQGDEHAEGSGGEEGVRDHDESAEAQAAG